MAAPILTIVVGGRTEKRTPFMAARHLRYAATTGDPSRRVPLAQALADARAALAAGTPIASIDLGSGTAAYQGDGSVVRLAVTQADRDFFATYNATRAPADQRATVGGISASTVLIS